MWNKLSKFKNPALLILRLGIGLDYILLHGWGKLMGGPERWERIGMAMANLGIDLFPMFWGFMAASAETFVAACFALGIYFRPSSAILCFTMLVAVITHLAGGDGWGSASHALKMAILFGSFVFIGPGKYKMYKS
jgi:putative oxidoreductase